MSFGNFIGNSWLFALVITKGLTTVRQFSEEECASIQLCVEQVAFIASEHGYKIELAWLTALLDDSEVLWIDSWIPEASIDMLPVLGKGLRELEDIVIAHYDAQRRLDHCALPGVVGCNDGEASMATTIAHFQCLRAMLNEAGARAGFLDVCGIADEFQISYAAPGEEEGAFDLFGACQSEVTGCSLSHYILSRCSLSHCSLSHCSLSHR